MSSSPRRALLAIDVRNEYFSGNLQIGYPPAALSPGNAKAAA